MERENLRAALQNMLITLNNREDPRVNDQPPVPVAPVSQGVPPIPVYDLHDIRVKAPPGVEWEITIKGKTPPK